MKNIGTFGSHNCSRNKQKAEGKTRLANWLPDVFQTGGVKAELLTNEPFSRQLPNEKLLLKRK